MSGRCLRSRFLVGSVHGSGFKAQGSMYKDQGSTFRVQGAMPQLKGPMFENQGSESNVRKPRFENQGPASMFRVQNQGSRFMAQCWMLDVKCTMFKVGSEKAVTSLSSVCFQYMLTSYKHPLVALLSVQICKFLPSLFPAQPP